MGIFLAQGCMIQFILKKIHYVLESQEAQSKGQRLLHTVKIGPEDITITYYYTCHM